MKSEDKGFWGCATLMALPFMLAIGTILNGWALKTLWGWFLVPLGAPALTLLGAIGVAIVVSFLVGHPSQSDPKKEELGAIMLKLAMLVAGRPLIAVGWAALVRWCAS
jgi:hypothetical protein